MYEVMQIRPANRKWKKFIALWSLVLLFAMPGHSQQKELQELITVSMQDAGLEKVLSAIAKQSKLSFSYDPATMKNRKLNNVQWKAVPLQKVLSELNALTGLEYSVVNGTLALRVGEKPQPARKVQGSIKGEIFDEEDNKPVPGVTVHVGNRSVITDDAGAFTISLPKGMYEAEFSSAGYGTKKVTGIMVHDDEIVTIKLPLKREKGQLGVVTVSARKLIQTGSNVAMVNEIRNADAVVSGISKEQITRSQDRDAAEVVRRISGVSIIQNRLVVIRGLPQRYNTVMLNNSIAPSFEPDSRAFSFDIMPSGLIDRVMIYKTAVPELPGDFAGGVIKVYTTEIPVANSFNMNYSASYNTNTTFRDFFEQKQGSKAWLGYDDGTYRMPAAAPARVDELTVDGKRALTSKFNDNWDPVEKTAPVDHRFAFDFGQRVALGNTMKLGVIGAFSYSNTRQYSVVAQNTAAIMGGVFSSGFRFSDQVYDHNVRLNGLLNLSLQIDHNHRLSFKNLYTHTGATNTLIRNGSTGDAASDGSGLYSGQYVRQYIMSNSYRGIYSGQLSGQHNLLAGTAVDWLVAYTKSRYDDPDQRYRTLKQDTAIYYNDSSMVEPSPGSMSALYRGRRYFTLPEEARTVAVNLVQSLRVFKRDMQLKAGFFYEDKKRSFEFRQLGYETDPEIGKRITEIYGKNNSYNAQNILKAGYIAAEIPITKRLKLYGGLRIEDNTQELHTYTWKSAGIENEGRIDLRRNNTSKLPSVNLSYALSDNNLLRAAYSKTLNRPEFREISTFFYMDMMTYRLAYGNEDLKIQTDIDNYDLRFEHYPGPGELFTAGLFYKKFRNPVEFYYYAGTSGYNNFQWNNAASAISYGAEIELMLGMRRYFTGAGKVSKVMQRMSVLLNAAYIHSRVDLGNRADLQDKGRALYGQSPYLINTSLNYTDDSLGLKINIGYNVIGKRLTVIGNLASPDIYEMPRNALDISFSQRIAKRLEIKGGIQNILNARSYQIQEAGDIRKLADKTDGTINGNNIFQSEYSGVYFTMGIGLRL